MDSDNSASGCVICGSVFSYDGKVVCTPCGHLYHQSCIYTWFSSAPDPNGYYSCPSCRYSIHRTTQLKRVFNHFIKANTNDKQSCELLRLNVKYQKLLAENDKMKKQLQYKSTRIKNLLKKKAERELQLKMMKRKASKPVNYDVNVEIEPISLAKIIRDNMKKINAGCVGSAKEVMTKQLRNRQVQFKM